MLKIFLNTSGISKLMKYNIFFSKSKLNLSIFVLLFFFITFYKSSTGNFLNGLPIITSLMDEKADMITSEKFGWVINDFSKKSHAIVCFFRSVASIILANSRLFNAYFF